MRTLTLLAVFLATLPTFSVPLPNKGVRIERLIRDLDNDNFRIREEATRELLRIGTDALPALREAQERAKSEEVREHLRKIVQTLNPVFDGHSTGWHWVYQDLAHSQTFTATGTGINSLRLRLARLNATKPGDDLTVEVRDPSLAKLYFRGKVPADDSTTDFKWHTVKAAHRADLVEGEEYVLIFHSRGTANTAPWAVNASYKDIYPHGRHGVNTLEDFFFEIAFSNRRTLRVGPEGERTPDKTPISSGSNGGTPQVYGEQRLADGKKLPDGEAVAPSRPK
jgi:hypothetical protein